jgi:hypothetical protein
MKKFDKHENSPGITLRRVPGKNGTIFTGAIPDPPGDPLRFDQDRRCRQIAPFGTPAEVAADALLPIVDK